jgi:hypothetical protein
MRSQSLLSIILAICLASTALADEWKTLNNCRLIDNDSSEIAVIGPKPFQAIAPLVRE